ncbi:MAG: hypothetical protein ACKO7W_15355 [Elainella sp.]
MEISRPNQQPLTEADLQHLDKLEAIIKQAVADGVVTRPELDAIKVQIFSNGKVMIEELDLVRELIREKARKGELKIEYFG